MNTSNKFAILFVVTIGLALLGFFSGSAIMPSGGMVGREAMGGINWMWIPAAFFLGLGVFVWATLARQKK